MGKLLCHSAIFAVWAATLSAQGVPTVDNGLAIRNQLANAHREDDLAVQGDTLGVQEEISEIEAEQLRVLDQILEAQTSFGGAGITPMVTALEDGTRPEQSADLLYGPTDPNPGAPEMFGDATGNIEQLIIRVAQETHSRPGVSAAGLSVRQWRALLQAMIWQESRFTIGARSPVGAFGLTQIMPGTAGDLGIYPEYYDSPYLQVEGGARYLAAQLNRFDGNIIYALAAYNAGPGRVIEYSGVPPFQETQHYVTVIPQKYNEYLAIMGGVEALGTIDPSLLANSNLSLSGARAATYGNHSMASITVAAERIRNIVQRIGETSDIQESMALNTYARAELVRLIAARTRLQAARTQPLSAEQIAIAAARMAENRFFDFTLEDLD